MDTSLTHAYFQTCWISAVLVGINGNQDVCCNANERLWVCFAHVHAHYWSIQDLAPDVELPALWDGWACHSLSLFDGLPVPALNICEQLNQLESPEDYDKPFFKSHQCFPLPSRLSLPNPKIRANVGYCWTRWGVPFSEISSFSCLLSVLSFRTSRQGPLFKHG